MSLHEDYLKYQEDLQVKYGDKSVVLMQIGDFIECYQYESIGKTQELSKILNMVVTLRNKSIPHSRKNLYMLGFPKYMLSKHISTILRNNYTVSVYKQEINNPKNRYLEGIYSPSTYINQEIMSNNELMVINIEEFIDPIKKNVCKAGYVSHIDLSTGKNHIYEFYNSVENEINYLLHSINPCEIILCHEKTYDLEIKDGILIHYQDTDKKIYGDIEYQKSFLQKAFNVENPIEYIGLQCNGDMLYTYISLIQFAYEHDNTLINRLIKPEYKIKSDNLIMNNDAIFQLNLIDNKELNNKYSSLLKVIDKTKTTMGKRLIRHRLLNPLTDITIINERYNKVDNMIPIYKRYDFLQDICDIEKKWRKINLYRLEPSELLQLYDSFKLILDIITIDSNFTVCCSKILCLVEYIENTFNIELLKSYDNLNYYKKGVYDKLDKVHDKININKDYIQNVGNIFASYIDPDKSDLIKVINDKTSYCLSVSTGRYKTLKNIMNDIEIKDFDKSKITIKTNKTNVKLYHPEFEKKSRSIEYYTSKLKKLIEEKYKETLDYIINTYSEMFSVVIEYISDLDVVYSSAKVVDLYKYCRPIINETLSSHIECKNIRHPIIERIIDEKYIENDVLLDEDNSLLLYGVNSCGKSSYLRSIGINIILAQSGFYTSASNFIYKPFRKLMTKISITDNLFKNQSTFVLEMNELKYIQNNADEHSLILVDELTAGTEIDSALSIVVESIKYLLNKKSKLVFTTHIYEISDYLDNINIKHFDMDIIKDNVIFNRKLKDGKGKKLYGIEIAASLGLDSKFIRNCYNLRNKNIKGTKYLLNPKKSKYNKKKFVDSCERCGDFNNLHTHHIQEQNLADNSGMIGSMHKNIKSNLMILCEGCHRLVHH